MSENKIFKFYIKCWLKVIKSIEIKDTKSRSKRKETREHKKKRDKLRKIGEHIWRVWNLPSSLLFHYPPQDSGCLSRWLPFSLSSS